MAERSDDPREPWLTRLRRALNQTWLDPEQRFLALLLSGTGLFIALSLVTVGILVHQRLQRDVMKVASEQVEIFVRSHLLPLDKPGGTRFVAPPVSDRAWWDGLAARLRLSEAIVDLHFLDASGRVTYAQAASELGQRPLSPRQWRRLQAGTTQTLMRPGQADLPGTVFEVVVPVTYLAAAGTAVHRGAIVVVEKATPLLSELRLVWELVAIGGTASLLIFLTLLWLLVRRLTARSFRDYLTSLPNRRYFEEAGRLSLARNARYTRPAALLLADLNHFKGINDVLGHHAGDQVIKAAAEVLSKVRGAGDYVARIGGDEFAMLINEVGEEQACRVADRITAALEATTIRASRNLRVSASIGIAAFPYHGRTLEELLRHADAAMYHAKTHQLPYAVFDASRIQLTAERLKLESNLRDAIDQGKLEVHYQPVLRATDAKVVGYEALARWQDAGVAISPAVFIPLAESTGLIRKLDRAVLEQAAATVAALHQHGSSARLSVNLSAQSLADPTLPDHLDDVLERHAVAPDWLVLEVTERTAMDDMEHARGALERLRTSGFHTALDDFGTGYSSLAYLRTLPIDAVKIDQRFTRGIGSSLADETLIHAIISYTKALQLHTVAEGVETPAQHRWLQRHGIDYEQGYLHGKPVPMPGPTPSWGPAGTAG